MNKFQLHIIYISLLYLFIPLYLEAQIEIDKPIIFIAEDDALRQVSNLNNSVTDLDDVINAEAVVLNKYWYAETSINQDTLIAFFSPPIESYQSGLKIYVQFPDTQYAHISHIRCNNLQAKEIKIHGHLMPLEQSFRAKEQFIFIYDGSQFQVLKRKEKDCPNGFKEVNKSYCISENFYGEGTFEDAYNTCESYGGRICTWAEWYYACDNRSELNINNMISGLQWTDSGAVVQDGVKVVGNNSCFSNGVTSSGNTSRIRCCYDK